MRRWSGIGCLMMLAAGLALAGCGKSGGPGAPSTPLGTVQDVLRMVDSAYVYGAVPPPNADLTASLVATMDVGNVIAAAALFVNGTSFPSAGTVSVRANVPLVGLTDVALTPLSTSYQGSTAYAYTSRIAHPLGLDMTFDGVAYHRFSATGSAAIPAFVDSVLSVRPPGVSLPADGASPSRSADLTVTWSDAGADSTVYVTCVVHSLADTLHMAVGTLSRDMSGSQVIPASRLGTLPAGAATLYVARYRLVYHTPGGRKIGLACEAVESRSLTLL